MNVAATKKASLIELLFQKQVSETISVMLAWEEILKEILVKDATYIPEMLEL